VGQLLLLDDEMLKAALPGLKALLKRVRKRRAAGLGSRGGAYETAANAAREALARDVGLDFGYARRALAY
jgi:hypothetical protein